MEKLTNKEITGLVLKLAGAVLVVCSIKISMDGTLKLVVSLLALFCLILGLIYLINTEKSKNMTQVLGKA